MSTGHGSERAGVKPTVVLVHGAVADAGRWNGVIEVLQQQGYTMIALAHPPRAGAAGSARTASLRRSGRARRPQRPAASQSARWSDHAACRDVDPELFFPAGHAGPALLQISRAKLVCAACPVRVACLDWALASHQEAGIWGGTSEDERRALRRRHG
jgi:WhiB family transcriptional regulator, redox-sensing transcriptional regulator